MLYNMLKYTYNVLKYTYIVLNYTYNVLNYILDYTLGLNKVLMAGLCIDGVIGSIWTDLMSCFA